MSVVSEFYKIIDKEVPGGDMNQVINLPERQLYLTRLSMDGLKEMHEYSIDERLYEYFEYKPFIMISDTEKYLKRLMNLEGDKVSGRTAIAWFVRRIEDEKLIGTARLVNIDYNRKSVEWGYGIDPELWGEGYIFEIQELLKEYVFENLKLNRLYGSTMVKNERVIASIKVAGFKHEGESRDYYCDSDGVFHDALNYSMLAKDYFESINSKLEQVKEKSFTKEKIVEVVREALDGSDIKIDDDMSSVTNWDSLNHIKIILNIEKKTGYKFSPIEISQARSIKDIQKIINSK